MGANNEGYELINLWGDIYDDILDEQSYKWIQSLIGKNEGRSL